MTTNKLLPLFLLLFSYACSQDFIPLEKIQLPEGYHIEVYVDNVQNARALDFAPDGTLFIGSRSKGDIYAVTPDKKVYTLDEGLNMPAGIDFHEGNLYVSSLSRILLYENILDHLENTPEPTIVNDEFPDEEWHGWKFIKIGPDRKLYVPVGAACNVCDSANPIYATICRMDLDGSNLEIYASGVRNTVGFDWSPETQILWFTDNGRDWMGDNQPPDELNKAVTSGLHFGFPHIHGEDIQDPDFWQNRPEGIEFVKPQLVLPAHVAALGMRFYTGDMFEEKYKNGIFIAEHGSWNRSEKIGYRVVFVPVENGRAVEYQVFASGWLQGETAWGRPADVEIGPDGALYVSDDQVGCVYRIWYEEGR